MVDPCLELVRAARTRNRWTLVQRLLAAPLYPAYLHADTPQDRIERAVHRELTDLSRRADAALAMIEGEAVHPSAGRMLATARAALQRGIADGTFPRAALEPMSGGGQVEAAPVRTELQRWIEAHSRFERRLTWLLNPEMTRVQLPSLDPIADADQIWCFVKYEFRPEILWGAWGNAIKRIVQSEAVTTFFHATGAAEQIPAKRSEDTLIHYYYLFNWGVDSWHGRAAVANMNRMHGRYFIHNDGMKFVLLNAAFTVLDSLRAIGHRPLTDVERLGYFHAQIEMGKAMRIKELTHSWDEMRSWFDGASRAYADYAPPKRRMWESIEHNFDRDAGVPHRVGDFRRRAEVMAMDDSYRSALGHAMPAPREQASVRRAVRVVTWMRRQLPRGDPYIESLQNFLTYPNGVDIADAGEQHRSARMPAACPFSAQALASAPLNGSPSLPPLATLAEAPDVELPVISWEEVKRHNVETDLWVVFNGHVYDVSAFAANHPGGLKVLLKGAGRDMTRAFEKAGHSELTKVFALNFRVGRMESSGAPSRTPHAGVEPQPASPSAT